ncbi:DUF924 family protein [Chenggangzhangella methanolivorans]|uniref:DUF924 family protein n=1 Tax=Chenggangzhangella methanolivorans TaxID=1437009 RepID=A0A9E6UPH8_9HYPH|nr:DUF924 family protein [Chenggangzhangella methanolivorans]QZO01429.1 DUF924 family protein [Chenggangzhangella methanolivorans]
MRHAAPPDALAVTAFWRAAGYDRWFARSDMFDAAIRARMERLHVAAFAGALDHWDETPTGALALVILLDQVPRNLHRGTARAFASDERALAVATAAIARRFDRRVTREMRSFFYLPFEHAEDFGAQEVCLELFRRLGDENGLEYAKLHADIIRRFGRFPHRNGALGRASTAAERRFLAEGGFAG